jgi:hypothetical protein
MIRPGFLSPTERLELEVCVRSQREDHGVGDAISGSALCVHANMVNFYAPIYSEFEDSDVELTILTETKNASTSPDFENISAPSGGPGSFEYIGDLDDLESHIVVKSFTCSRPSLPGDDAASGQS